jgi:predicted O-methyltransferase YrrM
VRNSPSSNATVPYELGFLPLVRPVMLANASELLERDAETALWCREHSLDAGVLIQAAVDAGAVRSVQGRVPGKGVRTFIDATTFSDELARFLGQVRTGARNIAVSPARGRLRPWVRWTLGQPSVLRLAELFCRRPEHFVSLARRTLFWPSQIPEEIVWLMKLVAALRPRRLLEIGTATGGTLYLLARAAGPDARFATIDLEQRYDPEVLRSFAHDRQQIELIVGSSADERTIARVRSVFPDGLDLLFIDGDHSYDGIRQDFERYAPLVRPNGVVVFHDIVDDNITRFGIATGSRADGVPRFWRELRSTYVSQECVAVEGQDGFGIGVIFIPPDRRSSPP